MCGLVDTLILVHYIVLLPTASIALQVAVLATTVLIGGGQQVALNAYQNNASHVREARGIIINRKKHTTPN